MTLHLPYTLKPSGNDLSWILWGADGKSIAVIPNGGKGNIGKAQGEFLVLAANAHAQLTASLADATQRLRAANDQLQAALEEIERLKRSSSP